MISEVVVVEQILIRNLPVGTKAALRARAEEHNRSIEAEAREIFAEALGREPVTLVDLLSTDEGADIEFEPSGLVGAKEPIMLVLLSEGASLGRAS
jgi:antitoxin FitA